MEKPSSDKPLGLVAGSGALPVAIAAAQADAVFVVALQDEADDALLAYPHIISPIGHLKAAGDSILAAGCTDMVIIGGIQRPNMEALDIDEGGQWFLTQAMSGAHEGDDQLLKIVIAYFEMRGLTVRPAQAFLPGQTGAPGPHTSHAHDAHQADIDRAIEVARIMGAQDIGQSVAVARRLVLAVEGPEGTDGMLTRLRDLPSEFLGTAEAKCGVLSKLPKPQQDRRVDIPAIGQRTVELAAKAHLAGIVFEAGGAVFDDFDAVKKLAEAEGLFLLGIEG
jgi:DUF1009 family protein